MTTAPASFVFAARLAELRAAGCLAVQAGGHTVALCVQGDAVYAVDNRCPHMGFPLHRGTLRDGILTCHWHHARFDLATGGTFDQFADDVPSFPVELRGDEVWVDVSPRGDAQVHAHRRLAVGLERDLPLVIAKAALALMEGDQPPVDPFRLGLEFGVRYRRRGWGQGLTIHTCMANLLPQLDPAEQPRALYHGLAAVAADTEGAPPRFLLDPLPDAPRDPVVLRRWFRQFIEVRDAEGAERCLVSALAAGAAPQQVADMLFAAATDHRYIDGGHTLDFTNKALEALDLAGWEHAPAVLGSLCQGYAAASRMEESNAWRHPVDLVDLLATAFERLPEAVESGRALGNTRTEGELVGVLLGEDPAAITATLIEALQAGARAEDLAASVAYAAARRIAQFPESNEFSDWDTALHTFTFASAVHQGLRRAPSIELLRGVFDASMSVYLDRFLNVPPARLPDPRRCDGADKGRIAGGGSGESGSGPASGDPEALLAAFPALLDQQHRVTASAETVAQFLHAGGEPERLLAQIGRLLLREDRNFHTIQAIEAAIRQYGPRRGTAEGTHILIAAVRYLAAHAPTMRAQGQTYQIALRFARGEPLFEAEGE